MIAIFIVIIIVVSVITALYFIHKKNMELLCSVSSPERGTRAERRLIIRMLRNGVHPKAIFHDLYVRKRNGEFSQIDLVVATPQGVVAIEVKDYSGWIFGNENQKYWTQLLNYGQEKYRFYNPIMQNSGHIAALKEQAVQFAGLPIFNVVLFAGNCNLKDVSYHSDNTFVGYACQVMSVLKSIEKLGNANYTDKKEVARILNGAVRNGGIPEIVSAHLDSVRTKGWDKPDSSFYYRPRLFRFRYKRWRRF